MNTQLVDSIVQIVANLSPAERELVKQKLSALDSNNRAENTGSLTLDERKAFLQKPLAERRAILAMQAEEMATHYQDSNDWRELMAGDIIDD
ncbi:hypothetical protein [Aliterella atlantica]|uniref:hypothetical protein n=1 Tax=Aliterella atlantica TaxID=1827278 RepID=UPI0006977A4D|nr:hypothetical protein [Aliterella atlantica]